MEQVERPWDFEGVQLWKAILWAPSGHRVVAPDAHTLLRRRGAPMMAELSRGQRYVLPPVRSVRWTARRKAAVVLAVTSGRLSISEAQRRYRISKEEFLEWGRALGHAKIPDRDAALAESTALLRMLSSDSKQD